MAAAFGSLPVAAKFGIKTAIAAPFAFHSINGVRHLVWDTGYRILTVRAKLTLELKKKQVILTGWTVIGLSTVTTLALALM